MLLPRLGVNGVPDLGFRVRAAESEQVLVSSTHSRRRLPNTRNPSSHAGFHCIFQLNLHYLGDIPLNNPKP